MTLHFSLSGPLCIFLLWCRVLYIDDYLHHQSVSEAVAQTDHRMRCVRENIAQTVKCQKQYVWHTGWYRLASNSRLEVLSCQLSGSWSKRYMQDSASQILLLTPWKHVKVQGEAFHTAWPSSACNNVLNHSWKLTLYFPACSLVLSTAFKSVDRHNLVLTELFPDWNVVTNFTYLCLVQESKYTWTKKSLWKAIMQMCTTIRMELTDLHLCLDETMYLFWNPIWDCTFREDHVTTRGSSMYHHSKIATNWSTIICLLIWYLYSMRGSNVVKQDVRYIYMLQHRACKTCTCSVASKL